MNDLIKEARELSGKATPGPWVNCTGHSNVIFAKCGSVAAAMSSSLTQSNYNATFIARSRTLVPELSDALEKAEAELVLEKRRYATMNQYNVGCTKMCDTLLVEKMQLKAELAAYKEANLLRVHGEWVRYITDRYDNPSDAYKCSVCGLDDGSGPTENFCPNCGCDMRANEAAQAALDGGAK